MNKASDRRRRANRANAKKSTGPRTLAAKHITCRNAVKHGLSTPWLPAVPEVGQIETVTHLLVSPGADKDLLFVARTLARAIVSEISTRARRDAHLATLLEKGGPPVDEISEESTVSSPPSCRDDVAVGFNRILFESPKLLETLDLYERRRGRQLKDALKRFIASEADHVFTKVEVGILDEEFRRHLEAGMDDPNHKGRFHLPRRPTILPPRPVRLGSTAVAREDDGAAISDEAGP